MSVNQIGALERIKYNDEFREDFERTKSLLADYTRSDGLMNGKTIAWDVLGLSDEAEERTRDGNIPESDLALSQVTGTTSRVYKKYKVDDFDAYVTNPNVRAAMSKKAIAANNRAIDSKIITTLDTTTTTVNSGSAISFSSFGAILDWTTALWDNDVPSEDGNVVGIVTPRAAAQMLRIEEYKSADYVEMRPAKDGVAAINARMWLGVKWLMHTGLTGRGTATAKCHIYHVDALGHQLAGEPELHPYYDEDQDQWKAWAKATHAAALCLPRGAIYATHDDTAALS